MHSIDFIRKNPELFDVGLAKRNIPAISHKILEIDTLYRTNLTELQRLNQRKNEISKLIPELSKNKNDIKELVNESKEIKEKIPALQNAIELLEGALKHQLSTIPNIPDDSVPVGKDSSDNVIISHYRNDFGEKRIHGLNIIPLSHDEIGKKLDMMDFETATTICGSRFVYLYSDLARLERSIGQFMLDVHTEQHGFIEVNPPLLVKQNGLYGTGQLPKFEQDLFKSGDYYLIPTSEVSLTNIVNNKILELDALPLRFTAMTPCFRLEAGSAGQDTKGMIRQHQFEKVELVSITTPDKSNNELEYITSCAENIIKLLELPYRKILLCTSDMGFSSQKTYDLEVWLPSQNCYREISSCSNCGDFQARRMMARYRDDGNKFVHTLNGSGLAVGRTLVAILENYYYSELNCILIPKVLQKYMNKDKITISL